MLNIDFFKSFFKHCYFAPTAVPGLTKNIRDLMGSYVFIDMFLGILFVLSTGSILYYKQLTEAFADRGRYSILRKIGTKKKELHPQVTLNIVCSSYFDMTFAGKNFDLVISTYSFYHFTAQQKAQL